MAAANDFALFGRNLFGEPVRPDEAGAPPSGPLAERYVQPPFSVLDARQGPWQERKRAWLALGIQSELGRGETLGPKGTDTGRLTFATGVERNDDVSRRILAVGARKGVLSTGVERKGYGADYDTSKGENAWGGSGSSIFDPALCELLYSWFCPAGGLVLDPFAGGSVRGIVSAKLGRPYLGVELRGEQVEANRLQAAAICGEGAACGWREGDSREVLPALEKAQDGRAFADMVFSCPPYADLERYSDDPRDLSTMSWDEFREAHAQIIRAASSCLRPDRFAAWVVGNVRDPKGHYRDLVGATVDAFERAGLRYYNEAVLVTAVGSLPLRTGHTFDVARKLGKAHQNVLVFVKGDFRAASAACNVKPETRDPDNSSGLFEEK